MALVLAISLLLSGLIIIKKSDIKSKMTAQINKNSVRFPAVAGSFYPAEPKDLGALIDEIINAAERIEKDGRIKIHIVPHAGLEY